MPIVLLRLVPLVGLGLLLVSGVPVVLWSLSLVLMPLLRCGREMCTMVIE